MLHKSLHHSSAMESSGGESPSRPRTFRLKSFTGDDWYEISIPNKTCTCPDKNARGCEHLAALGIHRLKPFTPSAHPTFSQALSALVKSLRLRRIEDAIYWLVYLDTLKESQYRFRTARRILIGSAEDGHSIPVMEEIVSRFRIACKLDTELLYLIADAIRICLLPNRWNPASGGHDYIYASLVGERLWLYKVWDRRLPTLQTEFAKTIEEQNRAMAIGAVIAFRQFQETFGATKQAE
jgi:hypothetical protein